MSGWHPISDAPRDGTTVLLLYPSGRVEMGRWEHVVRTVNGETRTDRAGWSCANVSIFAGYSPEPIWFARIPALPPRREDGYVSDPIPSEGPRCE